MADGTMNDPCGQASCSIPIDHYSRLASQLEWFAEFLAFHPCDYRAEFLEMLEKAIAMQLACIRQVLPLQWEREREVEAMEERGRRAAGKLIALVTGKAPPTESEPS